jgi:hypothetical protein
MCQLAVLIMVVMIADKVTISSVPQHILTRTLLTKKDTERLILCPGCA